MQDGESAPPEPEEKSEPGNGTDPVSDEIIQKIELAEAELRELEKTFIEKSDEAIRLGSPVRRIVLLYNVATNQMGMSGYLRDTVLASGLFNTADKIVANRMFAQSSRPPGVTPGGIHLPGGVSIKGPGPRRGQ